MIIISLSNLLFQCWCFILLFNSSISNIWLWLMLLLGLLCNFSKILRLRTISSCYLLDNRGITAFRLVFIARKAISYRVLLLLLLRLIHWTYFPFLLVLSNGLRLKIITVCNSYYFFIISRFSIRQFSTNLRAIWLFFEILHLVFLIL